MPVQPPRPPSHTWTPAAQGIFPHVCDVESRVGFGDIDEPGNLGGIRVRCNRGLRCGGQGAAIMYVRAISDGAGQQDSEGEMQRPVSCSQEVMADDSRGGCRVGCRGGCALLPTFHPA